MQTIEKFMARAADWTRDFDVAATAYDMYRDDPEFWDDREFHKLIDAARDVVYGAVPVKEEARRVRV